VGSELAIGVALGTQVNASTRHEEGYPPGFSPGDLTADAGPLGTPPVDNHQIMDHKASVNCRL